MNTLTLSPSPWFRRTRTPDSTFGLALVIVAHLAVVWFVLHTRVDALVIVPPHSLQVRLITPDATPEEVVLPVPRPVHVLPAETRILATPKETSSPATTPSVPVATEAKPLVTPLDLVVSGTATKSSAVATTATVTQPRFDAGYLDNPVPPYPGLSRRLNEKGLVMLRVFVSTEGLPDKIELSQSSGFARLDTAALETVRRWRFVPARLGEERVSAWVLVPISFNLRS